MNIYALGTHSDWYYGGGSWGKAGQRRIADLCAEAGITRLYWRTHNGGEAKYPSRVGNVSDGQTYKRPDFKGFTTLPKSYFAYMEYVDYAEWDQLTDMAGMAASVGIEYALWYTIFEDDHGGHLWSHFLHEHPQYQCRTRDGQPVAGSLDFFFPEVRDYKRRVVAELLEKPGSRLLLDFVRRNGTPSADGDGHYRYGYNPEIVAAFREATGLEAHTLCPGTPQWEAWLDFNAAPLTAFVIEIGQMAQAAGKTLDLLLWPVDQRGWLALDLPAIAKSGALGEVLVGSHTYSRAPQEITRQLDAITPQVAGSDVTVFPSFPAYQGVPPEALEAYAQEIRRLGLGGFLLCESDAVLTNPISDRLRAIALDRSHTQRAVSAPRITGEPDWERLPMQSGFLRTFATDDAACDQTTAFQIAHDGETLHLRVICHERAPEQLLPVPGLDPENYNGKQLGPRMFFNPYESVHFFLDYHHQHEEYVRFMVDPAGCTLSGQGNTEEWPHPWEGQATIGKTSWTATLRLPLGAAIEGSLSGKNLGFQLVRIQNQPRETSTWFNSRGRRLLPHDFGHLFLE